MISSTRALDFPISPKALDFNILKFPDVQQGSRFPNFEISSPKVPDLEIVKSRALGLDLWKFGNLDRVLGLEIWKFENLEPWGWTFRNLEI